MGSLAKKDLHLSSSSFYHEDHGAASSPSSDQGSGYGYEEENCSLMEKTAADIIVNNNGHTAFPATDLGFRPQHHHLSLINFKSNETDCFGHATGAGGSLLSFQQDPNKSVDSFMWKDDHHGNDTNSFGINDLKSGASESHQLIDHEINNYQPASSSYGWLYSDSTVVTADRVPETRPLEGSSSAILKRPYMGDHHSMAASTKKQCTGLGSGSGSGSSSGKNSKSKSTASNKDPQSLAAKNRRERISERLKVLQELVPNGPKVDLVTMLEKAISYVKFLQLQVKVLATDEFWPAQGGKAPDISQVKEAIDAILASQRERSSSSK